MPRLSLFASLPWHGLVHAGEFFNGSFFGGCASIMLSSKGDKHGQYWLHHAPGIEPWKQPSRPPPTWTKDLVIYEIAPRGFTSPEGAGKDSAGSGTFKSMMAKIPYLRALGITGVWLAGYCKANAVRQPASACARGDLRVFALGITGVWLAGYCKANAVRQPASACARGDLRVFGSSGSRHAACRGRRAPPRSQLAVQGPPTPACVTRQGSRRR